MSNRTGIILLFIFLFVFRVAFGFSQPFFGPDELQTYLIGLKFYTTGSWPYFGPDIFWVERNFEAQIPGALESLLIGLPFYLWHAPEAPFLLLNLLNLAALGLLAWYISKRIQEIPFPFILTWLALLPWNLHESTNFINYSFLLPGSVLFFIGFLEALPGLTLKWLSPRWAFALMGFGLFWDMQFHFSWLLLPPFVLAAFLWRWWKKNLTGSPEITGFLLGSIFPLLFLVPTLIQYGWGTLACGMGLAKGFNNANFLSFFTILARYLSLPSYEIPRYLGPGHLARIAFLKENLWFALPAVFLTLVGWIQPFLLLGLGWFKDPKHKDSLGVCYVVFLSLFMVWGSFWFTEKYPAATSYYILIPLISIYSFYIWAQLARYRGWRVFGMVCIVASIWFEGGYLVHLIPRESLYLDRPKIVKAIQEKNYHLLGERREGSLY